MFLKADVARGVTAVAAVVEVHGGVAGGAIGPRSDGQCMVDIPGGERLAPGVDPPVSRVVTGCAAGYVAGVAVTGVAGQGLVGDGQVMMPGLVGLVRRVAVLAAGIGLRQRRVGTAGVQRDGGMTVGAGQGPGQHHVMTVGRLALVARVAVGRPRCVGVAALAILQGPRRGVVRRAGIGLIVVRRPVGVVMAILAIVDQRRPGMAISTIAGERLGRCMVGGADLSGMAAGRAAARERRHGGVTGGAVDRIARRRRAGIILGGEMVGRADFAHVAFEAIGEVADVGVTLGAVAARGFGCGVMSVLLGDEGVAAGAIAAGGDTLVALAAQPLRVKFRLVMCRGDIGAVALGAIRRGQSGGRDRRGIPDKQQANKQAHQKPCTAPTEIQIFSRSHHHHIPPITTRVNPKSVKKLESIQIRTSHRRFHSGPPPTPGDDVSSAAYNKGAYCVSNMQAKWPQHQKCLFFVVDKPVK